MQTFSILGADFVQQNLCSTRFGAPAVPTSKAQMQPNIADLETLHEIARFQKAAFTADSELAPWRRKNESRKKYPCLTRSGAPAQPRPCHQTGLNSANFETLPGTNGI